MSQTATTTSVLTSTGATPPDLRLKLLPARDRACLAAKTAADNKGQDILVLDLRGLTPMFDYFVLATGSSRRTVHTIVEEIDAALRDAGDVRMSVEGYDTSKWIVQDYGDVLTHVFDPDTRDYYKIEELWADAKRIDWEREFDPDAADEDDDEGDAVEDLADEDGEERPEVE